MKNISIFQSDESFVVLEDGTTKGGSPAARAAYQKWQKAEAAKFAAKKAEATEEKEELKKILSWIKDAETEEDLLDVLEYFPGFRVKTVDSVPFVDRYNQPINAASIIKSWRPGETTLLVAPEFCCGKIGGFYVSGSNQKPEADTGGGSWYHCE